ncbi:MAG: hypothetical protein HYT73_03180 [Candidatus Aenigmarchaeota archaeon]|nr:hypothetical protein [Candidatus Aenigmarchaeota archaeon]
MKGQTQAISLVLISGILIGVVSSVYFWGLPLIQKNQDISILQNSEQFMKALNEKVKNVANNGGRDKLTITVSGIFRFDPADSGLFSYSVETDGTIYATNAEIPLSRNPCSAQSGEWGKKDPEVLCVKSIGDARYTTTYTLRYIRLDSGSRSFRIKLDGPRSAAGETHDVIIENVGADETSEDGRNVVNTVVQVRIV